MKFCLIAAVLSCLLLSSSHANDIVTEQSLAQLEVELQNVNPQVTVAEEPLIEASPELEKVLLKIPELVQAAADEQINNNGLEEVRNSTETSVLPEESSPANNRMPKQLIGFIPTYVLRQAVRTAQEEQLDDFRSLRYDSDEDDIADIEDDIEEERALRRRQRFRKRNSKGHLKKSRRHKNTNRRNQMTRRKANSKIKTENRRTSLKRRPAPRKTQKKKKNKKRRRPSYQRN